MLGLNQIVLNNWKECERQEKAAREKAARSPQSVQVPFIYLPDDPDHIKWGPRTVVAVRSLIKSNK